jgi:hypothetical protein
MKFILGKKVFLITLFSCVGVVLIFVAVWTFNLYPVAFVGYHPIMAYNYEKNVEVATKFLNASNSQDVINVKELVFDSLIDQVGIDAALLKSSSSKEIQSEIDSQVSSILSDSKVKQSLLAHSISEGDAIKYLLTIEIKNQMLSDILLKEGKSILTWLVDNRKSSKVIILLPHAHWTGSEVKFD